MLWLNLAAGAALLCLLGIGEVLQADGDSIWSCDVLAWPCDVSKVGSVLRSAAPTRPCAPLV
ncbi:hypothetical protein M758_UG219800 [Ceratodon purpureus]|nr:hypothetical protein M758_UG219800 [Ceratodon purpureus]